MTGTREQGKPVCQSFAAFRVDQAVEREVLEACQPLGIEASLQALTQTRTDTEQKHRLLEIALEKARYEADRARRQYDAVDPANRLVAAELEARWNLALVNATEAESRLASVTGEPTALSDEQRQQILGLGANLNRAWNDPKAPLELKKRIIRTAIREIIIGADGTSGQIDLAVHWAGGAHTRLRVTKNKVGRNQNAASQETVVLVRELARGWSDRYIAQMLNRIGSRTGPGNSWSENRVKSFRGQHDIKVFSVEAVRPWLTMEEAATELGVSVAVVRTMVKQMKLPARQIAAGLPWMIERQDLARPEVTTRVRGAKLGLRSPREEAGQTVMPCI